MKKSFFFLFIITFSLVFVQNCYTREPDTYIRISQVGYLPDDIKKGVILSKVDLNNKPFSIIDLSNADTLISEKLSLNSGAYGNFPFTYRVDFSSLNDLGTYILKVNNEESHQFKVGFNIFNAVVDTLIQFYKIQRCGYTEPSYHDVCHISDATSLLNGSDTSKTVFDVTGGWHDAGDYVKFLNTTAYSVYTLLFSYEFDPVKFNFDLNKNNQIDLLEEAKVGLDWLLRCNYNNRLLVTQVQDLRDHEVGWRMPEKDPLQFDRPAFLGIGKNLIGIYSASLAIAARIWRDKLNMLDFSNQCLNTAETFYNMHQTVPDVDSSGSGMYIDSHYAGKLALAAIELYQTTKKENYLRDAVKYADQAGSDYWWSWGDINAFAQYRLAKFDPRFVDYIKNNLIHFNTNKDQKLFGEGAAFSWGTNNTLMGVALQVILWKDLTKQKQFDNLMVLQRDYMLGRNQWGISFIQGIGSQYTRHFHHQIAYLMDGYLPGGFAAGPVSKEALEAYNIPFANEDYLSQFQTEDAVYRDDRQDYVTNEPTITANATAIFVFGYYSSRR